MNEIVKSIEFGKQLSFVKADQINSKRIIKKSVNFRDLQKSQRQENLKLDENGSADRTLVPEKSNKESIPPKRGINKEIEKNKGLTPKRPKEYRNPRVRNRLKARKALIKHKTIVPKVRSQDKRYSGEATGIRTGVVRAVKIK